jgi:FkbM family methyltransferase
MGMLVNVISNRLLRVLPYTITKYILENFTNGLYGVAYNSLKNRNVYIIHGVGSGLKFNVCNSSPNYALGVNEMPVQVAFKNTINCGDIVYDIGANIGFFSIIASSIVERSGHVYSFEPNIDNIRVIKNNIRLNKFSNITVIERAVSDFSGKGELHITEHPGGHTLFSVGIPRNVIDTVTVDIDTIDNLIYNKTILPPTVVKIDVEGAEFNVLRGMVKTLEKFHPTIIYEIDDTDFNNLEKKQSEIDQYLKTFGYEIQDLEESYKEIQCFVRHAVAIYRTT